MEKKEVIDLCNSIVKRNLNGRKSIKASELDLGKHNEVHIMMWIIMYSSADESIYTLVNFDKPKQRVLREFSNGLYTMDEDEIVLKDGVSYE